MSSTYAILDDLVKLVIRSFYPDDFAVIIDALLREKKRVRDEQLANTLRVQQKYVRKILLDLKGDSMVKSADVKIEGTKPGERATTQLLWYIDYKHIIDIVKYKLWMFGKKMESIKVQKIDVQTYRCTVCSKIFTAYDIPKLLSPEGELFCDDCDGELVEDHNNESLTQTAKHQSDLSSQLKKIVEQLKKTEGLQIPIFARDLAEESSGAGSNLTINANSSSGFGPKQSAFAPVSQAAAKTPLNTNPNSIDFVIEILENDNIEMNKAPVKKDNKKTGMASLPPWLLPSNSILNKSKSKINNPNDKSQSAANAQKDSLANVKKEPVVVDQEVYLDYIKNHYKEWESYDPSTDTASSKRALEDENDIDGFKNKKIKHENSDDNDDNNSNSNNNNDNDDDDQQVASTSQSSKEDDQCDVFVQVGDKYIPLTQVTEQDQEDMTAQEYEDYSTALYKYATRNILDFNYNSIIA